MTQGDGSKQQFLVRVAEVLHRYGTPSHRLERVMTKVSRSLGEPGIFLYTPTALLVSFGQGDSERTYLRRVDSGTIDAEKLLRFDEVLECLEAGAIPLEEASRCVEEVVQSKPPYSNKVTAVAYGGACAAMAIFFRGSAFEVVVAGLLGFAIAGLEILQGKLRLENGLHYPVAGFIAAITTLGIAQWQPLDDRLVTLAALVVMLPGFALTVALTELAVGHLSSGVARLAGASVVLLTMFVGVAIAWRIGATWRQLPSESLPLNGWATWLAIAYTPAAFAILFRVRLSLWPLVFAICWAGFFTSQAVGASFGLEAAAFFGALAVGCGSNFYARWYDRPAMILLAPGMIMLVPGSLGYRSLAALQERQTMEGVEFAFGTLLIAMSLVGGTLAASALVPPRRIL